MSPDRLNKEMVDKLLHRATLTWVGMLVVLFGGGLAFTLQQNRTNDLVHKNRSVVEQIQRERKRNTLTACLSDDRQNAAIRGFVRSSIPKGKLDDPLVREYLERARRTFPDLHCQAEVRRKVSSKT